MNITIVPRRQGADFTLLTCRDCGIGLQPETTGVIWHRSLANQEESYCLACDPKRPPTRGTAPVET